MKARNIVPGVDWLGYIDWDRRLFDSLVPLPHGTSYNAYLVTGSEKVALIDTVDPPALSTLLAQLENVPRLDYLVALHAEQDHSGVLGPVLERYPEASLVCTPRCKGMLIEHLHLPEDRFQTVEDGEKIELGGKTLHFMHMPWIHWPETMVCLLEEDKILFSTDLFGSHLATSDLYADEARVYEPAKRYYAEIMMPLRLIISRHIPKIEAMDLAMIAPSHGPVYRRPEFIVQAYREWVIEPPRNQAVIAYVSMHGSTKVLIDELTAELTAAGVSVHRFDLENTDIGELAVTLVDAATIVIGTPTMLGGAHPLAAYAAFLANALKPKARFAALVGSYGWGGRVVDQVAGMISSLELEILSPLIVRGLPREDDLAQLRELAQQIVEKHKTLAS